jgi:hypothetical protein
VSDVWHVTLDPQVADQNHSGAAVAAARLTQGNAGGENVAAVAAFLCKAHVELDRNLAAMENSYEVGMFKCLHWRDMAKNDLLVGVPSDREEWIAFIDILKECRNLDSLNINV